ncbi:LppX_LprAFG lipoprotein [Micromonospora nigra]
MAACGSKPGSDAPEQTSVLELLATDLRGSLQKTMEATDKSDSVTAAMQGTMGAEKISMQGVFDLGDPVKAEMTTSGPDDGAPTIVRLIGTVIFVEVPAEERAGMDGKRWMKLDLSAAGEQLGMDFTKQFENIDPIKQVKTLLALEGVTVVGEETVNGARTVHYTVTAPVATYLGHLDAELRSGVEKQYAKQGVKEVTMDLWVDEEYRPRRAGMNMGKMGDMTVDYTDYGKPVNIETPPAAETFDFAEMLKGLSAGN